MKFTANAISKLKPGETIKDHLVPGLTLRKGTRRSSYYLKYRDEHGKQRRPAIGTWPVLEPKMARQKALSLLRQLEMGELASESMTLQQIYDLWIEEEGVHLKTTTLRVYRSMWTKHIQPALGEKPIGKITYDDWLTLHKSAPRTTANRAIIFSYNLYDTAKKKGAFKGEPPSKLVKQNTEKKRTRRLNERELRRLVGRINNWKKWGGSSEVFATLVMLYLYTSCRKTELMSLDWSYVRWDDRVLELPDTKTGYRLIPLSEHAIKCLEDLNPKPSGKVFTFNRNVNDFWNELRDSAGLSDLRLHDLRRSVASFGLNDGLDLKQVGAVLGHSSVATTEGYAYLEVESTRKYSEQIGNRIDNLLNLNERNNNE